MELNRGSILTVVLLILLVVLQYRLWFEPRGVFTLLNLKKQFSIVQQKNTKLKQRNESLRVEISHLNESDAIESRARGELGMIRKGETFYHENIIK